MSKAKLIEMLNEGLRLEHQARAQYLSHAKAVVGENADQIIARLEEIAGDELKHEGMFRDCLDILDGTPVIEMAEGHPATGTTQILKTNLKDERHAIDVYRTFYDELNKSKAELKYEYEYIEHKLRHIIMDEEDHALELRTLLDE